MEYKCLVCGFDKLKNPIYDNNDNGTYEICVCCGFQYGYDDFPNKQVSYVNWREKWIKNGYKWFSNSTPKPKDWNPKLQLQKFFDENTLLK